MLFAECSSKPRYYTTKHVRLRLYAPKLAYTCVKVLLATATGRTKEWGRRGMIRLTDVGHERSGWLQVWPYNSWP